MKKIITIPLILIGLMGWPTLTMCAEPIVLNANTPVITPIKPNDLQVLVEGDKALTLNEVLSATNQFKQTDQVGPIQSTKVYWLSFEIKNNVAIDRDFRLTSKTLGLLSLNAYLIHENGEQEIGRAHV